MTDVQVIFSLQELEKGSEPASGPTVVKKLQLMLNQRAAFLSLSWMEFLGL